MKNYILPYFFLLVFLVLNINSDENNSMDYKEEMRMFVERISGHSRSINPGFYIIPQNGQELLTLDGEENGIHVLKYIKAIDGVGREDLFYGYSRDNRATPKKEIAYMLSFLNIAKKYNLTVLVTDYCRDHVKMEDSYSKNNNHGYISFSANERNLNNIPDFPGVPHNVNSSDITSLANAKNFLYIINPERFSSKSDFLNALSNTNYDIILIDLFFNEEELSRSDINSLKVKKNGGKRLILGYMSIGEAEDYRYYWKKEWGHRKPAWMAKENPEWEGNYKVKYWHSEWQKIILRNGDSYLNRIISAGFDGVYLDIIDAFEYFE